MTPARRKLLLAAAALFAAAPLAARTVTLTEADCDKAAVTSDRAPRVSWAGQEAAPATFTSTVVELTRGKTLLMRYPLGGLPKDSRVTRAEWVIPVVLHSPKEQKLHVRRVLADWGAGVCHDFRMTRPKKLEWGEPGARGLGSDRALKPTAVAKVSAPGEAVVNVTEDVELWHSGAATNRGWAVTVEDPDVFVRVASPVGAAKGVWKLRITYEPR